MTTTEERIAKLERSTARWRFATVGMVGVLAVGLMAGQGRSSKALSNLETTLLDAMLVEAEPKVMGIASGGENTDYNWRLIRVWSDGTTETMRVPKGENWDAATQSFYAGGTGTGVQGNDPKYGWRPVINAPHPAP